MSTTNFAQSRQQGRNPSLQQKQTTVADTKQLVQSEELDFWSDELEESELEAVSGGYFGYFGNLNGWGRE
jgi:hypothetical protein